MKKWKRICWNDTETYCRRPIKNGLHNYAEEVEILLWAYAIDDGPVKIWDVNAGEEIPDDLVECLVDPDTLLVWQNSQFDRTVVRHALGIVMPLNRIHDTMIQAMTHGLPGALGTLCEIMNVPTDMAKDKRGKQLIQTFCKPNRKGEQNDRYSHPQDWADFIAYAKTDISAMRVIFYKMPMWNYQGAERELWEFDQEINDGGVCVDTELANAAIAAVAEAQGRLARRTMELTYNTVERTTQRDRLLAFICEAYGVDLPDLQMVTLERRINDPELPIELRELLAIRLQASTTSTAKYKTLINGVSFDGRLRGCLQFCGAQRTGRWAGRLFQPQNLPRPVLKQDNIDFGIAALKAGVADLFYPNVMELTSSAIRGCIIADKDKKLVVSDLSNIEGRAAAYLAGEGWKLKAFRDFDTFITDALGVKVLDAKGKPLRKGHDLYNLAYAKAFDIPVEDVVDHQRQIGKVMELMLGYEGGVGAFITGAASYGIDLEELGNIAWNLIPEATKDEARRVWNWASKKNATFGLSERAYIVCDSFKRLWREAHPAISSYWPELQQTVVDAINTPGVTFSARKLKIRRDGAWLRIVLPSGRALCYASPQVENGKISYMGINQYSRKWSRTYTYGGKLFENVCQAFARDIMGYNMRVHIKPAGYTITLTVHDEVITEAPNNDNFNAARLSQLLATNPPWAPDIPLAAGGFEGQRYKKG